MTYRYHHLLSVLFLVLFGVTTVLIPPFSYAATSPFFQTDWSGGSGQTELTNTAKFQSSTGVTFSTQDQLTLAPTENWYDADWNYRKEITFNNSDQTENLTNFPVLIKLNSSRIDYNNTQNSGQDIRFTDSDGTTLLDYEIETWNESGDSYVWVNVPQIDGASSSDSIYMYYGNSGASDAQSASDVWNDDYVTRLHFTGDTDTAGSTITDSTSNDNTFTLVNGATSGTGVTGNAFTFARSNTEFAIQTPDVSYPQVYGSSDPVDSEFALAADTDSLEIAQGFQAQEAFQLSELQLRIKRIGSPTTIRIRAEIQTDNAGKPSGTVVTNGTSDCTNSAVAPTSFVQYPLRFSSPVELSANTQYHFVIKGYTHVSCAVQTSTPEADGNFIILGYDSSSPTYSNGSLATKDTSTWTTDSSSDLVFQLFSFDYSFPSRDLSIGGWVNVSVSGSNYWWFSNYNQWELWTNASTQLHHSLLGKNAGGFDQALGTVNYDIGQWQHVVMVRDPDDTGKLSLYINGSLDSSTDSTLTLAPQGGAILAARPSGTNNGTAAGTHLNGSLDEIFVSNAALSADWIAATFLSESDGFATYGSAEPYTQSSGSLTSSVFDTQLAGYWGTATWTATTPTNTTVTVKARSSNSATMSGATEFSSCTNLTLDADFSDNACITDGHRYIQYQVTLTSSEPDVSPTFQDISLAFDDTKPTAFNLLSPSDTTYTRDTRPTFSWRTTDDLGSGINRYVLIIDNGDSSSFTIDSIPASGNGTLETDKYFLSYQNFSDTDDTNNYISLHTRSSSSWSHSENDGALKAGKRTWQVKAIDNAGNARTKSHTLFVDTAAPKVDLSELNSIPFNSDVFSTTTKQPTLSGKIIDYLSGESPVAAGPDEVTISIDRLNSKNEYETYSISTLHLEDIFYLSTGKRVTDNRLQTDNKYAPFNFTVQEPLEYGTYRFSISAADKTANRSGTLRFTLEVAPLNQITTPQEQQRIEEILQEVEATQPLSQQEKTTLLDSIEVTTPTPLPQKVSRIAALQTMISQNISSGIENSKWLASRSFEATRSTLAASYATIVRLGTQVLTQQYYLAFVYLPDLVGNLLYDSSQGVASIFDNISNTTSSVAQATNNGIISFFGASRSAFNGVALAFSTGIENTANSSKHALASVIFSLGSQTQSLSDRIGFGIVQVGYNFVSEPTRIYDVKVELLSPTSAKISWMTNHPANGKINYGLDETYPFDLQSDNLVEYHEFILTDLKPDTEYSFEVMSHSKHYVYDANRKFTTPSE